MSDNENPRERVVVDSSEGLGCGLMVMAVAFAWAAVRVAEIIYGK